MFRWKFLQNPYGDSLHVVAYDRAQIVGTVSFWRNDLDDKPAYQCVDLAVSSEYQRRGIFREMAIEGVNRLGGAYLYTFIGNVGGSLPGFLRQGWVIRRKVPITVHSVSGALKHHRNQGVIPEKFANWRFAQHPTRTYFVHRSHGQIFLLNKRRENCFAVGGRLASDLGLEEVKPRFLLSYDFPERLLSVPRHLGWLLERNSYKGHSEFILGYRSDGW